MTVSNSNSKKRAADKGVTTVFPFDFKIFIKTDLKVFLVNQKTDVSVEHLLIQGTSAQSFASESQFEYQIAETTTGIEAYAGSGPCKSAPGASLFPLDEAVDLNIVIANMSVNYYG